MPSLAVPLEESVILMGITTATGRRHGGRLSLEGTPVCSASFAAPEPGKRVPTLSDIYPPGPERRRADIEPAARLPSRLLPII